MSNVSSTEYIGQHLTNGSRLENGLTEIKHEVVDLDSEPECETRPPESPRPVITPLHTSRLLPLQNDSSCNCVVEEILNGIDGERDFARTLAIIGGGRPQPVLASSQNRLFKDYNYEKVKWLTGCTDLNRLYCWPCLLFNKEPELWNRSGFDNAATFHKMYKKHEVTQNHIVSSMQLVAFVMNHCENKNCCRDELNANVRTNREVLAKVVETVCTVGMSRPSGIGPRSLLRMSRSDQSIFCEIPDLHIRIVNVVSNAFHLSVSQLLNDSPFVSLFLDEVEDNIAVVARYTNLKGEVKDTFLDFVKGNDLNIALEQIKNKYNLRGKIAGVLLGNTSKVESLVTQDAKLIPLHSPGHRISSVIPKSLYHLKECASFFHIVGCFEEWLKDPLIEKAIKNISINANVAQWREWPVTALHDQQDTIKEVILGVVEKPATCGYQVYTSSLAIDNALQDMEFIFLLKIFNEIFPLTDSLMEMILSNSPNVKFCSETIDDYIKVLAWKKEKFNEFWNTTQESDFEGPAVKKPRHNLSSKLINYYKALLEMIVDAIQNQIETRFKNLKLLEFVDLLKIESGKYSVSERLINLLRNKIDVVESTRMKNELSVAYAQVDFRGLQCDQLLRHLFETGLGGPLKQTAKLARLCMVLPYASKSNYDTCFRLFAKIRDFVKRARSEPEAWQWAHLVLESRLINRLIINENFLDIAIDEFAKANKQIPLVPVKQQQNICTDY